MDIKLVIWYHVVKKVVTILDQTEFKNDDEYLKNIKGNKALENCINRAYRDFNRTLHGFGSIENNEKITIDVKKQVVEE